MKRWMKWGVRSAVLWGLAVLFAGVPGWTGSPVYGASAGGQLEGQPEEQRQEQRQGQWRGQPEEQWRGQPEVQGTETGVDQALQDMGLQDEMEGLPQFLDDVMGQQDGEMEGLS
ncbi:MAG: sporulation protein, partial [Enterocloster clostridioformis]|nr:sporulation protein [Enterocloster clostridioformis]